MAFDEELFEASLCLDSTEWTKQALTSLPAYKGVLLLVDAKNRPIQLLQAANLRRTAQAKLIRDPSTSHRKADISELAIKLFYTCCCTQFELSLTYIRLAHVVFRTHSADWIRLPKISLAVIETDAYLPYFYVSENPACQPDRRVFGLFPTRKAAMQFCDILNTVFILCRNPALLNTGKEASCPYLQMQTCPSPCLRTELLTTYSQAVMQACRTAEGHVEPIIHQLREKMHQASQAMQFEQAAMFKKQNHLLRQLDGSQFQWTHTLPDLCVLHIDKGPKRKMAGTNKKQQLYRAWKITYKTVYELGDFVPRTNEQTISFLQHTWNQGRQLNYTMNTKEHLAILSYSLLRSNPAGLWLDCSRNIPEEDLTNALFDKS